VRNDDTPDYIDEIFDLLPEHMNQDDPRAKKAHDLCEKLMWPMAVWDVRYRTGLGIFAMGVLIGAYIASWF